MGADWAWLAGVAGSLGMLLLTFLLTRPPRPRPAAAPPSEFSAERAHATVEHLAGNIGLRIPGQPGFAQSLEWLRTQLEALPGWEVEVQEAVAARDVKKSTLASRHVNLIARLPGADPDSKRSAILVNSHLDSTPAGPGAADDVAAVAAMLEAARILAAGPRPRRSIIFLFNGSEEFGLLGAASFVERHPLVKDVAAFINLEAAGCGYPFNLFQVAPDAPAALRACRRLPRPAGSVLGQDLFESRVFPNDTDYRVFAEAGLRGVDFALTGDGYAYHTWQDHPGRLAPGALQHMGDTLMALLAAFQADPEPGEKGPATGSVYFDLFHRYLVAYPKRLAPYFLAGAGVLAAVAAVLAAGAWPWWAVPMGLLRQVGVTLAGVALPVGAAWAAAKLIGHELWWYARPAAAGVAWVLLAAAGIAGAGAIPVAGPAPGAGLSPAAWAGAMLFWLVLGALLVWKRLGSAYLPTAWLTSGALGLLLLPVSPPAAAFVAAAGAMLVTASAAKDLLTFTSAHFARNAIPAHLIMAGLYGFFTVSVASYVQLPPVAGLGALALGAGALLWSAQGPALTPERPELLTVLDLPEARAILPAYRQLSPTLRRSLGAARVSLPESLAKQHLLTPKHALAVPALSTAVASAGPAPELHLLSDVTEGDERRATIRCISQGYDLVLSASEQVRSLRIDAGAGYALGGARPRLRFTNPPPDGLLVTFSLPADSTLTLTASAWYLPEGARPEGLPASTAVRYHPVAVTTKAFLVP